MADRMTADAVLNLERSGRVATIAMNRPKARNALDRELLAALASAVAEVGNDPEIRAVILTGSGGSFCAGADLKKAMSEGMGIDMSARIDEFHAVIRAIAAARQPFVAAIDGAAVGFGADLALGCELRVMSTRAYLQEKFVNIGLMPDGGGTFLLPRLVGTGIAFEALLFGDPIDAEKAARLGLANEVVAPEELAATAMARAQRIAAGPPLAIAAIKRAVRAGLEGGLDHALAREKAGQLELLRSQDLLVGVAAWMSGTTPEFKGA
jgi:enoyl-CoA hydratase/carnithine racemase